MLSCAFAEHFGPVELPPPDRYPIFVVVMPLMLLPLCGHRGLLQLRLLGPVSLIFLKLRASLLVAAFV